MRRPILASMVLTSSLAIGIGSIARAEEPNVQLKDLQVPQKTELQQNMDTAQKGYEIQQKEQQQKQMEAEHPDPHGGIRLKTSPNDSVGLEGNAQGGGVNYRHTTP